MNRRGWAAFAAGIVFAVGLGVAGMTRPSKILAFLDVDGAWDPSLAFVMGAALAVGFITNPWIRRRGRPAFDDRFHLPTTTRVDARLLIGAAVFGLGWGIGGFCPGPSIVAAATGNGAAVVFVIAMLAGVAAYAAFAHLSANRSAATRDDG